MYDTRKRLAGALFAIALAVGCARNPAPPGWLPTAEHAGRDAFGAWIVVEQGERPLVKRTAGELIVVGPDTIHVLTDSALVAIPAAVISKATVAYYQGGTEAHTAWTLVGTLGSASHGWFAVISAPVWIVTGTLSGSSASREPLETVRAGAPRATWAQYRRYARFPQGFPRGLDRQLLVSRR
jgi:hypothetical protein